MAGGGIGVATKEELILMHCVIEMGPGTDAAALRRFAPLFVESVEKWRTRAADIVAGREKKSQPAATGVGPGGQLGGGKEGRPKPGGPFIKI